MAAAHVGSVAAEAAADGKQGKPLTEEKRKEIEEIFKSYDKDGSGAIDLKELRKMVSELGGDITEEEAAAAMQELDKDGTFTCNLDEFILWWTAKPAQGGGYKSLVLDFMKMRLKAERKLAKTRGQLAKAKNKPITDEGTMAIKGFAEISPGMAGVDSKMSVTLATEKKAADSTDDAKPEIVMTIACENAEAASSLATEADATVKVAEPPVIPTIKANGDKVEVSLSMPPEMLEGMLEEFSQMLSMVESTLKTFSVKANYGFNADTVLENPDKSLPEILGGFKVTSDVVLDSGCLCAMDEMMPPPVMAAIKLLAGTEFSYALGYNQAYMEKLIGNVKKDLEDVSSWRRPPYAPLLNTTGDIKKFWDGVVEDPCSPLREEDIPMFLALRKALKVAAASKGLETVAFKNLPGISVDFVARFEDCNPWKVLEYVTSALDKLGGGTVAAPEAKAITKKLKPEEEEKLKEVFDKYDKDKSGAIDLKELQAMCAELGGSLTDEQAKEAMTQLDTDKTGSCSFQEFTAFWSSQPGLGGYSSMALKVLKMKLAAGSALGKHKERVVMQTNRARTMKDDLSANFTVEVTPGMAECPGKMNVNVTANQEDASSTEDASAPSVKLKLAANSEGDAKKAAEILNTLMTESPGVDMLESIPFPPKVSAEGASVMITVEPPAEVAAAAMEEMEEMVLKVIQWIKTLKGAKVGVSFGSSMEDWLASPDTTLMEQFGGFKVLLDMSAASTVRTLATQQFGDRGKKGFLKKALKVFAGMEAKLLVGYHQKSIKSVLNMIAEGAPSYSPFKDINTLMTPSGMCRMFKEETDGDRPLPEAVHLVEQVFAMVKCLKGIDSLVVSGTLVTSEESRKTSVTANFENFNPFCIAEYFIKNAFDPNTFGEFLKDAAGPTADVSDAAPPSSDKKEDAAPATTDTADTAPEDKKEDLPAGSPVNAVRARSESRNGTPEGTGTADTDTA